MDELESCILELENSSMRDNAGRRMHNFIATMINRDYISMVRMVHCKIDRNNAVFLVKMDRGSVTAYLKIMAIEEYREWVALHARLVDHDLGYVHPTVVQHGEVPNGDLPSVFGYSIIESFGRSISEIEEEKGSRIDEDTFQDMKEWLQWVLGRLHAVRLYHGDVIQPSMMSRGNEINKGNVLCKLDENGHREFKLIDFGAVKGNPALSLQQEKDSLQLLKTLATRKRRHPKSMPRARRRSSSLMEMSDDDPMANTFPPRLHRRKLNRRKLEF